MKTERKFDKKERAFIFAIKNIKTLWRIKSELKVLLFYNKFYVFFLFSSILSVESEIFASSKKPISTVFTYCLTDLIFEVPDSSNSIKETGT